MEIQPITKINVADEVYDQMLTMILSGTFEIDEKIPSENVLCEKFNVSRHTIRTVLNRFTALGMIESIPGDGTYLRNPSGSLFSKSIIPVVAFQENSVFEVMEYRLALESESARLCAERITDSEINALEIELIKLEKEAKKSPIDFAIQDIDFHVMISEYSRNSILLSSMEVVRAVQNAKISNYISKTNNEYSQHEHREIFDAIKERDAKKAADRMVVHLNNVIERFKVVD